MISNLDGSVIANAINEEANITGHASIIERMLTELSGAKIAQLLNEGGYEFLKELILHLEGAPLARALNAAGETFLTELLTYMDPQIVVDIFNYGPPLVSGALQGSAIRELVVRLYVYRLIGIPLPVLGYGNFNIVEAAIYVPPASPGPATP